jgi:predicted PhzF superfamily epimerase YddE/YHI9
MNNKALPNSIFWSIAPASFQIRQGGVMGRPSLLNAMIPTKGGITVSGTAVCFLTSEE